MWKISKCETCFAVLKYAGILACSAAFVGQIIIAWLQFKEEATVASITSFKSDAKVLPCITFCPYSVFKNAVYPITIAEFEKYSYQYLKPVQDFDLNIFYVLKCTVDLQLYIHNPGKQNNHLYLNIPI